MHNGAVGLDGSLDDFIVVLEVDNDDIGACPLMGLLADTDVVVGF